ncbi:hypothetical protein [Actinomadura litoris]|uniref:hypothetical protein n=1 Tax=Actinomadura litoris TaxID=2678616 RepID=UPI001FA75E92|nr:hypothetical protein [Actinomadura litoris]
MLRVDYINYPHSGRSGADYFGGGGEPDFTGLAAIMKPGPWPDILAVGEADRWDWEGGVAAYAAVAALRAAGGPAYEPLCGSLPREAGSFAPALLVNPQTVQIISWGGDMRRPGASSRSRNLLRASLPGHDMQFLVVVVHGDIHSGEARLADAKTFDRLADPAIRCLLIGDWNATLSGPCWDVGEFGHPLHLARPDRLAHKILWRHGPAQAGPFRADTRALDYLCGYWMAGGREWRRAWLRRGTGRRVGGIGFYDVAELTETYTPTQLPISSGRRPRAIDRALVNAPWRDAVLDFRVYPPVQPTHPGDHLRISVTLDMRPAPPSDFRRTV